MITDAANFARYKSLAAAVMLCAVRRYLNGDREGKHDARIFFFSHPQHRAVPFNLQFYCEVLNLRPEAIREAVRKRKIDTQLLGRSA